MQAISLSVDTERCIGCGECVRDCSKGSITLTDGVIHFGNGCFGCGHCIAVCPRGAIHANDPADASQVLEYNAETFAVSGERMLNFIKFRRTIRRFEKRPVAREVIEQLLEAGRYTETASNLQNTRYIVVTEKLPELSMMCVRSLKDLGEKTLAQEPPAEARLQGYAKSWLRLAEQVEQGGNPERFFFNAPAVILVTAVNPVDGGLASEALELTANAMGLGVLFSGFFVRAYRNDPAIKEFLGIQSPREVITCMGIGYPAVKYHRTVPRKPITIEWM